MTTRQKFLGIAYLLLFIVGAVPCFGATENLDEVIARQARQGTAAWGPQYLEDNDNNYIWQPETLCYQDATTGREVWRLTPSTSIYNTLPDISWPQWSADGKRFSFHSKRTTNAFSSNYLNYGLWMVMKADGSHLRTLRNAPARTVTHADYMTWSPVLPDVYYEFGRNYAYEGLSSSDLYKVTVGDTTETRSLLLHFPSTMGELGLKKAISADGKKIVATNWSNESWWYPATVYPEAGARLDDPDGHSSNRPFDNYWGKTASRPTSGSNFYHDQFLTGAGDDVWFFIMPEVTDGTWWRTRISGSAADGGSAHTADRTAPYNWGGELEPVNCKTQDLTGLDPWCDDGDDATQCSGYWSHFTPDRWGRLMLFSSVQAIPLGTGIYDLAARRFQVETYGGGALHHDWHAFSDWSISSSGTTSLRTQNYRDPGSQIILNYTHAEYTGTYQSHVRPSQSPDGTKAVWHSTFLNSGATHPDIFYSVAYYPYPPEMTACTAAGGTVRARVDWRLDQASPRGYTLRGWPDEQSDNPPPPREIAQFRLWRSSDGNSWTPVAGAEHDIFERYDFAEGTFRSGQNTYWELSDSPGEGTWYYGVTSIEHSGLESRSLSNVFRITVTGGSGSGTQSRGYPQSPGADGNFYTAAPPMPVGLTWTHRKSPASAAGQYTLEWTKPAGELVRYFNIYAEDGATPQITQTNRIASVPAGAFSTAACSWVDCFGNTGGTTRYVVTSVDSQGNESGLSSDSQPPTAPDSLVAASDGSTSITLNWQAASDNTGVQGYRIYRDGACIDSSASLTYIDTGLAPSTTYTYAVSAYDSAGNESGLSNSASSSTGEEEEDPAIGQTLAIIAAGDTWRYFKGTSSPGSGWTTAAFDDASWLSGPTGIGYGTTADNLTQLSDMQNSYLTVYARRTFTVQDPSEIESLSLSITYDDGYVAYLNGQEIGRSANLFGTPSYNTGTSAWVYYPETAQIDLTAYRDQLSPGTNVLAIEVHNHLVDSVDASLSAELEAVYPGEAPADLVAPQAPGGVSMTLSLQ